MKLGDFKTPTGQGGNIFKLGSWLELILGSMVLIIAFSMGQVFTSKVGGSALGRYVDTTPEYPFGTTTTGPSYTDFGN